MKRNTLFGGLALLLAGGAIGAGAMISSNAMATDADSPPANEVTMVNVGPDGEAVKCTFVGAEVDALFASTPDIAGAPVVSGAYTVSADVTGAIEIDPENLPEGVTFGASVIPTGGEPPIADGSVTPADPQILSLDDAREGTPEECAAMREQAISGVPAEGSMVIGSATIVSTQP